MATVRAEKLESRDETITKIWKDNRGLYGVAGFILGLLFFPAFQYFISDLSDFLNNLVPEALGILVTVFVIEQLNRQRDERNAIKQLQEQLVRDASSTSNEVAKNAVHQLDKREWLEGTMSLLVDEDLSGANLQGADLISANLEKANLRVANLKNANLAGANLSYADLWEANLERAYLYETDLRDAFAIGADLTNANLSEANLQNAHFQLAFLIGAKLNGANLKGVNLEKALLEGVDLGEGEEQVIFDETTILPDGTYWTSETDMTRFTHPERHAPTPESATEESE
jgi:uncharacterized protein YjbI with pentapeptide repeats